MKLYNPTDKTVSIQYKGVKYSIKAESNSEDLTPEVAEHWMIHIHQFLMPEKKEAPVVEQTTVTPKPKTARKTVARKTPKKKTNKK